MVVTDSSSPQQSQASTCVLQVNSTVPAVSAVSEASAPAIPEQGPPYVELADLRECDGLALGSPTRFGNMAAQMKNFIDQAGGLWAKDKLVGKVGAGSEITRFDEWMVGGTGATADAVSDASMSSSRSTSLDENLVLPNAPKPDFFT